MKNAQKMALFVLGAGLIAGWARASTADPVAGPWHCRLMFRYSEAESAYRSMWRFDPVRERVEIRLSPIHQPLRLAYRWDGRRLTFGPPLEGHHAVGYDAYLDQRGQLVIDQPDARWKGWVCAATSEPVAWGEPLVYRDAGRYPWLRDVAEALDSYSQR